MYNMTVHNGFYKRLAITTNHCSGIYTSTMGSQHIKKMCFNSKENLIESRLTLTDNMYGKFVKKKPFEYVILDIFHLCFRQNSVHFFSDIIDRY